MIPAGNMASEDVLIQPWITATGAIAKSDGNLGTFNIDPQQYVSAFKDAGGARPLFPIRGCIDMSSKRFTTHKPSLKNNRFISIAGRLSRIQPGPSPEDTRFCVEVENFDFLGYAPPPAAASPSPSGIVIRYAHIFGTILSLQLVANETPLKGKMKFSFANGSAAKKRKLDQSSSSGSLFTE